MSRPSREESDAFGVTGDVLELACGPGTWTASLLARDSSVTAIDAAPEMLAIARARVADGTAYRLVKVPHTPEELEASLRRLGWEITVRRTTGPFYWGAGHRAQSDLR